MASAKKIITPAEALAESMSKSADRPKDYASAGGESDSSSENDIEDMDGDSSDWDESPARSNLVTGVGAAVARVDAIGRSRRPLNRSFSGSAAPSIAGQDSHCVGTKRRRAST